ncbi:MAG: transcriptional repressor LexA, partial [Peptostreptococcaceae bacterium]
MMNLSKNQLEVLKTIKWKIKENGYPPSVREICSLTNIRSTSTVHSHMNKLEELGYIRRDPTKPRAIEVLMNYDEDIPGLNQEIIELPVIEFIKNELKLEESVVDTFKLPSNLVIGKENFIFKVKDDRLIEIGVLKNDYVIVDRSNEVKNNKIIISMVDEEEIILARYFNNGEQIELKSENCFCDPLILKEERVNIIGKINGNFRVIK